MRAALIPTGSGTANTGQRLSTQISEAELRHGTAGACPNPNPSPSPSPAATRMCTAAVCMTTRQPVLFAKRYTKVLSDSRRSPVTGHQPPAMHHRAPCIDGTYSIAVCACWPRPVEPRAREPHSLRAHSGRQDLLTTYLRTGTSTDTGTAFTHLDPRLRPRPRPRPRPSPTTCPSPATYIAPSFQVPSPSARTQKTHARTRARKRGSTLPCATPAEARARARADPEPICTYLPGCENAREV